MSFPKLILLDNTGNEQFIQKCFIGKKLFCTLCQKLGENAVVTLSDTREYLVTLWPREDSIEGYIQLSNVVQKNNDENLRKEADILCTNIKVLKSEGLKWLKFSVILDDYKCVRKIKNNDSSKRHIIDHVILLLQDIIVKEKYCIDCSKLELGKLLGIRYILIDSIPISVQCGHIKQSTKLNIDKVMSKDHFQQSRTFQKEKILIGGFERYIRQISEIITIQYEKSTALDKLGGQCQRCILLYGPPGCGKTSLVKYIASACKAHLLTLHGADIVGARPGETEKSLEKAFMKAAILSEEGPSILFIDEIDTLIPKAANKGSVANNRVFSKLISLLDDMSGRHVVIATTNRISSLDNRLRQPGRLEKEIIIGIPDQNQRCDILSCLLTGITVDSALTMDQVAEATPGYLPADLVALVQHAWATARKNKNHCVTFAHFHDALHTVVPTTQRGSDILVTSHNRAVT